jgi:hypothetical protein
MRLELYAIQNFLPLKYWIPFAGTWIIGDTPISEVPAANASSIFSPLSGFVVGPMKIDYDVTWIGPGNASCSVSFLKDGVPIAFGTSPTMVGGVGASNFIGTIVVDLPDIPDKIIFGGANENPSLARQFNINSLTVNHDDGVVGDFTARTDFINFVSSLECGQRISYKASKDFYLIPYLENSGYFTIFIPAQFSIKQFPTTQKELQLTDKLVETAGSIKEERLFQLVEEGLPDFMHKKIKAIFMHGIPGVVYIDGKAWIMSNDYEEVHDRPDTFKPYLGKVWLTRKNFSVNTAI